MLIYMHIYIYIHIYEHIYIYIHTYIYIYIHTHIYIYIHIACERQIIIQVKVYLPQAHHLQRFSRGHSAGGGHLRGRTPGS